jgi:hypothetical protein
MTMTDFFTKCHILGEIYREDMEDFKDFIKVNDIAFPIAYLHVEDLALAQQYGPPKWKARQTDQGYNSEYQGIKAETDQPIEAVTSHS